MRKEQLPKKKPIMKPKEIDKKFPAIDYSSLDLDHIVGIKTDWKLSVESIHQLHGSKQASSLDSLSNMLNGSIGCGILGMGIAFKHGGLLLSPFLLTTIAIVSVYNQHILVSLANKFHHEHKFQMMTLSDTIGIAFREASPFYKKMAASVRKSIIILIFMSQIGCCSIYLLYISQSLEQIFIAHGISINLHILMIITLPIILATSLIRNMKHIAPVSSVANISSLAALALILYSSVTDLGPITNRRMIGSWDRLPLTFGTMIFSMEGIAVTLPVQQNMKRKEDFSGSCGILNFTLVIVLSLTTLVGLLGYWKYGDDVKDSLTLNLELKDNILSQLVILCMMVSILCTYAVQFFVPISLVLQFVESRTCTWPFSQFHVYEYALRSILVLLTFLIAECMPYLNLIMSLIGAVAGSCIGFIYCSVADLITREKEDCGVFYWRRILCVISIVLGLIAFSFGTVISIREIIEAVMKDLSIQ